MSAIIAAIDVGYGHVKYCSKIGGHRGPEGMFPSVAPPATDDSWKTAGAGTVNLRVLPVAVKDKVFMIGEDGADATDGRADYRQRTSDYAKTDEYYAHHLAALARLDQSIVDVLVVGLPMSTIGAFGAHLQKLLTARHQVPDVRASRPNETRSVDVRRVVVVPQPVGALFAAITEIEELNGTMNIVVDTGYFTTDFICTKGKRPFPERCGAVKGGMAGFYDRLHSAAGREYSKLCPEDTTPFELPHHVYEEMLMRPEPILDTPAGKIDLTNAIRHATDKFDEYLNAMASKVTEIHQFNRVVLAGGGARLLAPRFKARFPQMKQIFMPARPQFAIVEGYLAAGAAMAAKAAQ